MNTETLVRALEADGLVAPSQIEISITDLEFMWEDSLRETPEERLCLYRLGLQAELYVANFPHVGARFHALLARVGLWASQLEEGRIESLERYNLNKNHSDFSFHIRSVCPVNYIRCRRSESEFFHREKHWKLGESLPFSIKSLAPITTHVESEDGRTF